MLPSGGVLLSSWNRFTTETLRHREFCVPLGLCGEASPPDRRRPAG